MSSVKNLVATTFDRTGLNSLLIGLQRLLWRPHIRAINYHDIPHDRQSDFEEQIRSFAKQYAAVDLAGLRSLRDGTWSSDRPGLIVSFDDGLRSHAEFAAPILEKYGFCGWFMVPVDFVDVPRPEQAQWARDRQIQFSSSSFEDGRIALSWNEIRELDRRHVIACHSRSHQRLSSDLDDRRLEDEISGAKRILEERLGHDVPVFAWVGGEYQTYSASAARAIRDAGFEFSFMTNNAVIRPHTNPLQLQRSNIEVDFPPALTRLTLSGFYDLMYWAKRRRVVRLTS